MLMLVVVVMVIPFIKVMMVFTKLMIMMMMVVVLTFPEQSLQDMPPVPRHLWHAFTTPVCGTVTTLTCVHALHSVQKYHDCHRNC